MRYRILPLKFNPNARESARHRFDIPETNPDSRPAELHDIAHFANTDAPGHIICFYFFRTASVDTGALVCDEGITESSAHNAWPCEFVRRDCGGWAYVGLWIESQAKKFQKPADRSHKGRVQPFHAHAAEAGVAFDAFVTVDPGSIYDGINSDCAHRTNGYAIAARYALLRVDLHNAMKPQKCGFMRKVFWAAQVGSMLVFQSLYLLELGSEENSDSPRLSLLNLNQSTDTKKV
jgi:hypothetical protein